MALIKTLNGKRPTFGLDCYYTENAVIVGDVRVGAQCSFWFHTVVRGDVNAIRIGSRVNVQDGAIIHCTYERTETRIGHDVSIGHRAIVHGCTIHDRVLIGMGAIIMDRVVIESDVIVAAGAVVPEGAHLESGWIYAGVPAKPLKPLSEDAAADNIQRIAARYVKYAGWYRR